MNGSIVKVRNAVSYSGNLLYVLSLLLFADKLAAIDEEECAATKCGIFQPLIRFPFRLQNRQPPHCGYPGFDLSCSHDNQTVIQPSNFSNSTFLVRSISYIDQSMYLDKSDDRCHIYTDLQNLNLSISPFHLSSVNFSDESTIFNCSSKCSGIGYYEFPCLTDHELYSVTFFRSSRDIRGAYRTLATCNCMKMFKPSSIAIEIVSSMNSPSKVIWSNPDCRNCESKGQRCRLKKNGAGDETECVAGRSSLEKSLMITGVVTGSTLLMVAAGAFFYFYRLDKNERESRLRIRKFLEDYITSKPSRYAYADIKRLTDNFKEKLGQGAYGTVFKGKISNNIFVAVKVLNNSNRNGEEFINEVATMGQIHHVNVVRLVGYCAEGFRRALIYEFLPNNSLEKYISPVAGHSKHLLNWETLQDIALGVAKGIEYLHQGCEQRILHFDIKPHNILLDQHFVPKISDFGMAKLCSKDKSDVSMNTARGTMGYIAPEVFSRNFGNISYKSDVYSFGIVLLEMVSGRKNTSVTRENDSEVYYPEWIYNLLEEGQDLPILIEREENEKIAKKLAIVGLRCIQWHPTGRPTMKAVVKMLERGIEELTMPPNPFASVSSSGANTKMLGRQRAQDLEAIAE